MQQFWKAESGMIELSVKDAAGDSKWLQQKTGTTSSRRRFESSVWWHWWNCWNRLNKLCRECQQVIANKEGFCSWEFWEGRKTTEFINESPVKRTTRSDGWWMELSWQRRWQHDQRHPVYGGVLYKQIYRYYHRNKELGVLPCWPGAV